MKYKTRQAFINDLPTKFELLEAILEFEKIDWSRITRSEINNIVPRELRNITPIIGPHPTKIERVFRLRPMYGSIRLSDFRHPQDFSYPPVSKCTMGRCNYDGQQVFYCSLTPDTTFQEAFNYDASGFFLSLWGLKADFHEGVLMPHTIASGYMPDFFSALIERFRLSRENQEILGILNSFMGNWFSKKTSPMNEHYKYSAYLANRFFQIPGVSFVCYPSVRRENSRVNFAYRSRASKALFHLERVYFLTLEEKEFGFTASFRYHGEYDPVNEHVTWKTMDENERERIGNMNSRYSTHV